MWTPAIDNVAVAGYRVHQDGSLLVEVDAGTLTARVTGLVPEVTYAFQVQAFDAMGNVSTEGPAVSVRIDGLAPTWPAGSSLVATVTGPGAATLAWTAALDNDEIAGYLLYRNGVIAHEVGATTLLASFSGLAANVAHTFQVQAFDRAGNVSADGPTAVLRFDGTPPSWPEGSSLSVTVTGARSVRFSWPAASDDVGVTEYRLRQDDLVVAAVPGLTADVTGLDPDVTYTFAVDAVDAAGNPGEGPTTTVYIGVPDPVVLAPPLDTTVPTTLYSATSFLYTGPDAIQKDVVAGTIAPHRTALLRGRVLDRAGEPIRDVRVTILGFPELGHTRTRADGMFDLVVNGGGPLTLDYDHPAYFPAQRRLEPDWETTLTAPDVVLVRPDPVGTEVTLDAPMAQVARGSRQEDEDGARQATLIIPPGTTATMKVGALEIPLSTARIRATEYTVGATGRRAMPAELPRASAYTYAVELSVDEAEALGAHTVTFSQPIAAYLENFLDLPVGEIVPSGYYDRRAGQWVPSSNGRAVRVVGESAGLALLDVTGDGIADSGATLTTLGITDVERAEVAALYDPGRSLWRVPVAH
ncbi:MAG: fibronectin type III domain-containing protein, partial [Actinobacteria bacterium]|nr:fibronectin type III domain-containing protein [Actinomycetota bacterium]